MEYAVCIQIKSHFNLRNTSGRGWNVGQFKPADALVISSHFPFSLQDVNGNRRLIIRRSGKYLALFSRNSRILLDQLGGNTAQSLNPHGERSNIKQQYVLDISSKNTTLNRGADCNNLIRIDALVGLFSEDFLYLFLHLRHAGHTTYQYHLVDIRG